jgi:tetraacyldisaccharide 4'-kinase
MKLSNYPLLPFSFLYSGITRTRNWLFDLKLLGAVNFPVPIINVGNLTVGGTGKTPHVEYLVRLLKNKKLAILSRGYKRQTKGFVLAGPDATPKSIGDEPFQYFQAFPEVTVAVCEDRVLGINTIMARQSPPEVVILDDAYQHRWVKARLNILITDYHRPFYQDFVLPAGRLRESRAGAARADIVIVSKSPTEMPDAEKVEIMQEIKQYARPGVPVFFTTYAYQPPVNFGLPGPIQKKLILVTGIAQPQPLLDNLKQNGYDLIKHFNFPDHHAYTQDNIKQIYNFVQAYKNGQVSVLTTQKDWTKLNTTAFKDLTQRLPIFYLPIKVRFLENEAWFKQLIFESAVIAK